ncbi:hypothetical protein KAI54_00210 [Candidatus Gracilibacteria bacterium]|nr:hypothetical protein [Candidatus Gracilibacteria bacterium]
MRKEIPQNPEFVAGGGRFAIPSALVFALNNPGMLTRTLLYQPEYVEAARRGNFDHFFPPDWLTKIFNLFARRKVEIPENMHFSTNTDFAKIDPKAIKYFFSAYGAQKTRMILEKLKKSNPRAFADCLFLCGSKGIEIETRQLMHKVAGDVFPDLSEKIAVLVGPDIAKHVFEKKPVVGTIAGPLKVTAKFVKLLEGSPILRPHESKEIYGLDLAGVVKNVHSIAFGIAIGLKLPSSTICGLMESALRELSRFAKAYGCDQLEIWKGISGDYALACSGDTRNTKAGINLVKKGKLLENELTEGVHSLPIVLKLAREKNVKMPIIEMLAQILEGNINIKKAVEQLTRFGRKAPNLNSGM